AFTAAHAGDLPAGSVPHWPDGPIRLLQTLPDKLPLQGDPGAHAELVAHPSVGAQVLFTHLGRAGAPLIQRPPASLPDGYDPRNRPWYTEAIRADGAIITHPYRDPTGDLVVTIATPVKRGGMLVGVVGGDLSLRALINIINSVDFGGLGHAFLVS